MPECEICGRDFSKLVKVDVDGVVLNVCKKCSSLGKIIDEPEAMKVIIRRKPVRNEIPTENRGLIDNFNLVIKHAREKQNLKQEEAAKNIGISTSLLKRIEHGFRADENTMKKIEKFFGISLYK
ncbi:MAG: TIGR00270 family protein [Candidatus Aenigmarchaeota archaeon]|nr:TIGR00270 family protein [Candidatus Aenigmarchaeota archaeon]